MSHRGSASRRRLGIAVVVAIAFTSTNSTAGAQATRAVANAELATKSIKNLTGASGGVRRMGPAKGDRIDGKPLSPQDEVTRSKIVDRLRATLRTTTYVPIIVGFVQDDWAPGEELTTSLRTRRDLLTGALLPDHTILARVYSNLPFMALTTDAQGLESLLESPFVSHIEEDNLGTVALSTSAPVISAPEAWAQGFRGDNQIIAVLDTGIETAHPYFSDRPDKVLAEACFSTGNALLGLESFCPSGGPTEFGAGSAQPCPAEVEGCDHGTHVAGIAVGNGSGPNLGIARNAHLIAVQVFVHVPLLGSKSARKSDVVAALDFVFSYRNAFVGRTIAAVNLSSGWPETWLSSCADGDNASLEAAAASLVTAGIAVIAASGNDGEVDALRVPACLPSVLSVGSTSDSDVIFPYTNVSPDLDFLAPGTNVWSAVPGGGERSLDGTSMATPHVAGAWAILRALDGASSVLEMRTALRNTGTLIDDDRTQCCHGHEVCGPCNGIETGIPRIDVFDAIQALPGYTPLSVQLSATPSSGTAPLAGVDLRATVVGGTGLLTYTFYCDRADGGVDITVPYQARFENTLLNPKTAADVCTYSSAGTYSPKVIVERSGQAAEDRASVSVTYSSPTCRLLTRERNNPNGGTLPIAAFPNSPGCPTGEYKSGELVYVGVTPSAGWSVSGWSGTYNDSSTATTNLFVMPAAPHTVRVNYVNSSPTCYNLVRDHEGDGSDPAPTPLSSPGCPTGKYVAGEQIEVEADPAAGWTVAGWDGTVDDSSTSTVNLVVMGAASHRVEVEYQDLVVESFELTIAIEGTGQGRVTSSSGGINCGNWACACTTCDHLFEEGTVVVLEPEPREDSEFTMWLGDEDCADGIVYMNGPRNCIARFSSTSMECHSAGPWHFGEGTNPVLSPPNSPGCPAAYFVANTLITFSDSSPASGWRITSWQGTDNDSSTGSTNTRLMPAHDTLPGPIYGRIDGRPTIETKQNVHVESNQVSIGYEFSPNGSPILARYIKYGPTIDYGQSTYRWSSGASYGVWTTYVQIADLPCGTTYHAVAVAEGTQGTSYGGDVVFETVACPSSEIFLADFEGGSLCNWDGVIGADPPCGE